MKKSTSLQQIVKDSAEYMRPLSSVNDFKSSHLDALIGKITLSFLNFLTFTFSNVNVARNEISKGFW